MKPLVLLLILFSAQFCNVKNKAMHTQEPTTPTINVKTTGAVGDGRHDDTRAIQNALSSLSKTGGTLFSLRVAIVQVPLWFLQNKTSVLK